MEQVLDKKVTIPFATEIWSSQSSKGSGGSGNGLLASYESKNDNDHYGQISNDFCLASEDEIVDYDSGASDDEYPSCMDSEPIFPTDNTSVWDSSMYGVSSAGKVWSSRATSPFEISYNEHMLPLYEGQSPEPATNFHVFWSINLWQGKSTLVRNITTGLSGRLPTSLLHTELKGSLTVAPKAPGMVSNSEDLAEHRQGIKSMPGTSYISRTKDASTLGKLGSDQNFTALEIFDPVHKERGDYETHPADADYGRNILEIEKHPYDELTTSHEFTSFQNTSLITQDTSLSWEPVNRFNESFDPHLNYLNKAPVSPTRRYLHKARRRGHLPKQVAEEARKIRKIGACWTCHISESSVIFRRMSIIDKYI